MKPAREWALAQPGADDMGIDELAQAIAIVEARDREVIEACADVAEAYEPHCESCPRGVAHAVRAVGG